MDQDEDPREGGATEMGRRMMPQAGVHTSGEPRAFVVCNNSSTIFKYFNFLWGGQWCVRHSTRVWRSEGNPRASGSLLPPHGTLGLNSAHQA